jgi:transposase-like protein
MEESTLGPVVIGVLIIAWFALPCIVAIQKGRSWIVWTLLSLVLPLVSLVILVLLPSLRSVSSEPQLDVDTSIKTGDLKDMTSSNSRKTYTEGFKKEVVQAALTSGKSTSEIARMFEVHSTLVRNWTEKYSSEVSQNPEDQDEETKTPPAKSMQAKGSETEPSLIWHIDRAKFVFSDPSEYKDWKKEKRVFFELSPSGADDAGEAVFCDPEGAGDDFEITEGRGVVKIKLEKDGPLITAWVGVSAETVDGLDADTLSEWANDEGGWASCSIHLGEFDASIEEDDGGDWRLASDGPP